MRTKPAAGCSRDQLFFVSIALVIVVAVFVGFARTYYLAGVFRAPLPNLLVHIHGAVFSAWVLLMLAQVSLVSVGQVGMHRRLGLVGCGVACAMVILGLMVATDSLVLAFYRWSKRTRGPGLLRRPNHGHAGLCYADLLGVSGTRTLPRCTGKQS